jgi:hypothetical protein
MQDINYPEYPAVTKRWKTANITLNSIFGVIIFASILYQVCGYSPFLWGKVTDLNLPGFIGFVFTPFNTLLLSIFAYVVHCSSVVIHERLKNKANMLFAARMLAKGIDMKQVGKTLVAAERSKQSKKLLGKHRYKMLSDAYYHYFLEAAGDLDYEIKHHAPILTDSEDELDTMKDKSTVHVGAIRIEPENIEAEKVGAQHVGAEPIEAVQNEAKSNIVPNGVKSSDVTFETSVTSGDVNVSENSINRTEPTLTMSSD